MIKTRNFLEPKPLILFQLPYQILIGLSANDILPIYIGNKPTPGMKFCDGKLEELFKLNIGDVIDISGDDNIVGDDKINIELVLDKVDYPCIDIAQPDQKVFVITEIGKIYWFVFERFGTILLLVDNFCLPKFSRNYKQFLCLTLIFCCFVMLIWFDSKHHLDK